MVWCGVVRRGVVWCVVWCAVVVVVVVTRWCAVVWSAFRIRGGLFTVLLGSGAPSPAACVHVLQKARLSESAKQRSAYGEFCRASKS